MSEEAKQKLRVLCEKRPAETREHIIKKSISKDLFGPRDWDVVYVRNTSAPEQTKTLQGPNAHALRPKVNLCKQCNSTVSQPFDLAFDKFDRFIRSNLRRLVEHPYAEPSEIFGPNPEPEFLNVKRYFAKALACYIDRGGYPVPTALKDLLIEGVNTEFLTYSVSINREILHFSFMGNGPLQAEFAGLDQQAALNLTKIGVPPEKYSGRIEHGPVWYELEFSTRIKDIECRAIKKYDVGLRSAVVSLVPGRPFTQELLFKTIKWFSFALAKWGQ